MNMRLNSPATATPATRNAGEDESGLQIAFSAQSSRRQAPIRGARARIPNPSVRVPVRRDTRSYLRALRAAELAAWEPLTQLHTTPVSRGHRLALRTRESKPAPVNAKDKWAAVVIALSAPLLACGLWQSFGLVEKGPDLLKFVRQIFTW
jgi:hypothetical protein